jgi:hypothetical protein
MGILIIDFLWYCGWRSCKTFFSWNFSSYKMTNPVYPRRFYRHVAGWLNEHFPNRLAIEAYWLANKIGLDTKGFFSPLAVLWKRIRIHSIRDMSKGMRKCQREREREMYPPRWSPVWIFFKRVYSGMEVVLNFSSTVCTSLYILVLKVSVLQVCDKCVLPCLQN